jgi:hypothetical protein
MTEKEEYNSLSPPKYVQAHWPSYTSIIQGMRNRIADLEQQVIQLNERIALGDNTIETQP